MSEDFYGTSGGNSIDLPLRRMLTLPVSIPTFIVGDSSTAVVALCKQATGVSCTFCSQFSYF